MGMSNMDELKIYKAFMEHMSDCRDWLESDGNTEKALPYVLGMYDMAVHLAETIDQERKMRDA